MERLTATDRNLWRPHKENTMNNVETCGILCGKMVRDRFMITHVIIPRQKGSADGCIAEGEEEVFRLQVF